MSAARAKWVPSCVEEFSPRSGAAARAAAHRKAALPATMMRKRQVLSPDASDALRVAPTWDRAPPAYVQCGVAFPVKLSGGVSTVSLVPATHSPGDRRDLVGQDAQLLGCLFRNASNPGPEGARAELLHASAVDGVLSVNVVVKQAGNYRLVAKNDKGVELARSEMFGARTSALVVLDTGDFPSEWLKDEGPKDKAIEFDVELRGSSAAGAQLKVTLGYGGGNSEIPSQSILSNLSDPSALGSNNKARLRLRVGEVSKNHQSRPFCFVVEVDGDASVAPCLSQSVVVKSKRNATALRKGANTSPLPEPVLSNAAAVVAVPSHLNEWSQAVAGVIRDLETNSKERAQIEARLKRLLTSVPSDPPTPQQPQQQQQHQQSGPSALQAAISVSELFGNVPPSSSWGVFDVSSASWGPSGLAGPSGLFVRPLAADKPEYIATVAVDATGSSDAEPFCVPAFNAARQLVGAFITCSGDASKPFKLLDELVKERLVREDFANKANKIHPTRMQKVPASPLEIANVLRDIATNRQVTF